MTKVEARIKLDAATWDRIDAAGQKSGRSRDEIIDEAVRRVLGGQALTALFDRARERNDLSEEEAAELVASEKTKARAETDSPDAEAASRAQCT